MNRSRVWVKADVMSNTATQTEFIELRSFRQQAYELFFKRKDSFFELMDAVIQTPSASSFAELSLASSCTRKWHSCYKAIAEVSYDKDELDALCLEQIPNQGVIHFAIDVMSVRRMHSETLKERLYCHGAAREVGGKGVIIGLPYSIVAFSSARGSSFAPSVNIRRIKPEEKAVSVAVEQVCWLGYWTPSGMDWRAALDGAYGNREFFAPLSDKEVQVVARTRCDRVFYRRAKADDYCGKGRRAVFGSAFRCKDSSTWGDVDEEVSFFDSKHGLVHLQIWRGVGFRRKGKFIEVDVIRSRIHLEKEKPPKEHWYVSYNGKKEEQISVRDWYETIAHRWTIEPANRFRKERLFAELPKVREAETSDHFLMAMQLIEWQLYLAKDAVVQKCLPWQKPLPLERITPNRVIQSLPLHYWQVGTPVRKLQQRGKGKGWLTGRKRKSPKKYKLVPKSSKKVALVSKNE